MIRFWLEHLGHKIELRPGALLVGRSSSCHVVLDDAMVSRRHGQFLVNEHLAFVEDLGSVNGVFLNGERVTARQLLREGDRIQIGKHEFVLRTTTQEERGDVTTAERFNAETLHGAKIPDALLQADTRVREEATRRTEALELLCGVADKVLALGRGDEAERILGSALDRVLKQAVELHPAAPPTNARAAEYATRIAEATGKPRRVDYCFELYGALGKPLPAEVIDLLHGVLRKVNGVSVANFRQYLERLRVAAPTFSPADRFLLQRVEGLERLLLR